MMSKAEKEKAINIGFWDNIMNSSRLVAAGFIFPPAASFFHNSSTRNLLRTSSRPFCCLPKLNAVSMANARETLPSLKNLLDDMFSESLRLTAPDVPDVTPEFRPCNDPKHGDYQCNNAMGLFKILKAKVPEYKNPRAVGQAILDNIPPSEIIEKRSIAGAGYVNVVLSSSWMAKRVHKMLVDGIETWAPKLPVQRAIVDFSSPNIAKEMHVGHLRSTIIGDTIARMLEYCNVDVLRRNHVGDWGTQFGMLIEYLFEKNPHWEASDSQSIGHLQILYKESKKRFDEDAGFKERAQQAVVGLQAGKEKYRKAWTQICEISRKEFEKVYQRLGVHLEEKGESFYNPYIPKALEFLGDMIVESDGARVIIVECVERPLIVVKSDGGYNYASTDLAALWYRLNEEKAEWIIYVTDVGQREHFDMFFSAAKRAGWLPAEDDKYPKTTHVGFGLVLGDDGKRFRTRSSEVVKLVDLLDEAKTKCKEELIGRGKAEEWSSEEIERTAEVVGYGAVKYADLKNNRLTNYTFNYDQMLNDKGNTAVYLQYAHARISSIIRKSGKDIEELKKAGEVALDHVDERALGFHLVKFPEVVQEACMDMLPHRVCDYLYSLSDHFSKFYTSCVVVGSEAETSRLLLCEATAVVMRKCFYLLGINPVYRL